jgi:hypothetical protein
MSTIKLLYLKSCLKNELELMKRMVFFAASKAEKAGEKAPGKKDEQKPKYEVDYKRDDIEGTLYELMRNKTLVTDSIIAIGQGAEKAGVTLNETNKKFFENFAKGKNIQDPDVLKTYYAVLGRQYWYEGLDKCKKVAIRDSHIYFLDEKGKPLDNYKDIPVVANIKGILASAPKSQYYDPETKIVHLEGAAVKKVKIGNIIDARPGTEVLVTAPGKEAKKAVFMEKNGKLDAFYLDKDGQPTTKRAEIYNGYKVELVNNLAEAQSENNDLEETIYKNHEVAVVYSGDPNTYAEFTKMAIGEKPVAPQYQALLNENNPKLQKLRAQHLTYKQYRESLPPEAFMTKKLFILVPPEQEFSKQSQLEKNRENAIEKGKMADDRKRYDLPRNFRENRVFTIKDKALLKLLGDRQTDVEKWRKAWNDERIEGIRILKGVLLQEPLLKNLAEDPDKVRTALQEAITKGKDNRIDVEDIVNYLFKLGNVRMPSYASRAEGQDLANFNRGMLFSATYNPQIDRDFQREFSKPRLYAMSFLQKLHAYETAKFVQREEYKGEPTMVVDFMYGGHIYRAKVSNDGRITIVQHTQNKLYYAQNGYSNELKFSEKELTDQNFAPNNNVEVAFKNAVTPLIDYDNSVAEYKKFFKGDVPKANAREDIRKFYQDLVIATNRIGQGVKGLKLNAAQQDNYQNIDKQTAKHRDLNRFPKFFETDNRNAAFLRTTDTVFPHNKPGETQWNDAIEQISVKYNETEAMTGMNMLYARNKFFEKVEKNGGIVGGVIQEGPYYRTLNDLAMLGLARLMVLYPDHKKYEAERQKIVQTLGLRVNQLGLIEGEIPKATLQNPPPALVKLIQQGLVHSLVQEETNKKEDMLRAQKELHDSLPEEDRKVLENALRKAFREAGVPEAEIEREVQVTIKEKILPIIPAIGADFNAGNLGLGIGVPIPVELGENGKYGVLLFGVGVGVGINVINGDVGPGIGFNATYKTPKLGPFSLIVGAGAGLSLSGIQAGFHGGIGVDFGGDRWKHEGVFGVFATPAGIIVPGIVISHEKNHAFRLKEAIQKQLDGFGFTQIDRTSDKQQKVKLIMQNPLLRQAVLQGNQQVAASTEAILTNYQNARERMIYAINAGYDPTGFQGISWGVGVDTRGKFVFLVNPKFTTSSDRTITYKAKKSYGDTMREVDQQISLELAKQILAKKKEQRTAEQQAIVENLREAGRLMLDTTGKEVLKQEDLQPKQLRLPEGVKNLAEMESRLNEIYAPLNIRVKYAPQENMFELLISDWNKKGLTNYEVAVDPAFHGAVVFQPEGNRIFLGSDFSKNTAPVILRGNFEYPLPASNGAHYLSVLTIGDNRETDLSEIYHMSRKILRAQNGGAWKETDGFTTATTDKIYDYVPGHRYNVVAGANQAQEVMGANSPELNAYLQNILRGEKEPLPETEKTEVDNFVRKLFTNHGKRREYKGLSVKEHETHDYVPLTNFIKREWEGAGKPPLSIRKINYVRASLGHQSFNELLGKEKPALRRQAYIERLIVTKPVMEKDFARLIKLRNSKYPEGDPRRITMSAKELATITFNRLKTIDPNSQIGEPVNAQEEFSVLGATEHPRLYGFREQMFTEDINPNRVFLGASKDYSEELSRNPNSYEANMSKLMMESFTPVPELSPEQFSNPEKVKEFLDSPLSIKLVKWFIDPVTQKLFSDGSYRDTIVRLIANRDSITAINPQEANAVKEYYELVQGIRNAEVAGEKFYYPRNTDFRVVLKMETKDGIYKECTNYSYWINENLLLQHRTPGAPGLSEGAAALGESRNFAQGAVSHEFTTLAFAGGGIVGPEAPPPPPPGPKVPKKADEGGVHVGAGDGKPDSTTGGTDGGPVQGEGF